MTTHTNENQHVAFDAMCAQIEDYETLPSGGPSSREWTRANVLGHDGEASHEHQAAPLNEMILAGLVSP